MRGVRTQKITQKTKVSKTAGKIGLNCDNCGLQFETYACWAKRTAHHFCSRSCGDAFKKIEIVKACKVCGTLFSTSPSDWFKVSTCSKSCLSKSRLIEYWKWGLEDKKHPLVIASIGKRPPNARLSDDEVCQIRSDARPQSKIAAEYGISQSLVSQIKRGKLYSMAGTRLAHEDQAPAIDELVK